MNTEPEMSDATIRQLVPNQLNFRAPEEEQVFYESVRIAIAIFKSGQETFGRPDDFTQMMHFHHALSLAIKKDRDADWSHVARLFEGLSQYSIQNLAYRAELQGKILPRPDDFRIKIDRLENAQIIMSIISLGGNFKDSGAIEPVLWVGKKREKTHQKNRDYKDFIEALAVAWDASFQQENGKFSARTRSKRDTPTPFVEFCRNLLAAINVDAAINVENLVNKMGRNKI